MSNIGSIPFRPTLEQSEFFKSIPAGKKSEYVREAVQLKMNADYLAINIEKIIAKKLDEKFEELETLLFNRLSLVNMNSSPVPNSPQFIITKEANKIADVPIVDIEYFSEIGDEE